MRFFYRRCILTDNMTFIDVVVETLTHMLFTCNKGSVYKVLRSTLQQENQSLNYEQTQFLLSVKLVDLKIDIKESDASFDKQI